MDREHKCEGIHIPENLFKYNRLCTYPSTRRVHVLDSRPYYYKDISNNTIKQQTYEQAVHDIKRVFEQDGGNLIHVVHEETDANIIVFPDHFIDKKIRAKYPEALCIPYALARNCNEVNLQPLEEMKTYLMSIRVSEKPVFRKLSLKKKKKSLKKKKKSIT